MSDSVAPYSLEIKDLRKSFGKTEIIRGVNLAVQPGETVAIAREALDLGCSAVMVPCATAHNFSTPACTANTSQRHTACERPACTAWARAINRSPTAGRR